jgi:repressor LexA
MVSQISDALSPQQHKVYSFLKDQYYAAGSMPSLREICSFMGWKAVGTAQDVVAVLIEKGWIEKDPEKARGLRISGAEDLKQVPILGSVSAGPPVEAIENHDGDVMVPGRLRGPIFALQINGDSMKDAGIEDGDIVIVKQGTTANNGEIIVAYVDGEATCKRFKLKKNQIWLIPENSKYKPRCIMDPSFRILGKVVGLHRYY